MIDKFPILNGVESMKLSPKFFCLERLILPTCLWTALLTMVLQCGPIARAGELLDPASATHKAVRSIRPMLGGVALPFKTFALSPSRELWLCCSTLPNGGQGKILVYDVDGQFLREIDLTFVPTAIGFLSSNGRTDSVFVAGSGKIAKLSASGECQQVIDAPNIGNREEVLAALREEASKEASELVAGLEKQHERLRKQIVQLETGPDEESPEQLNRRKRRLKLLLQQEKQMELTLESVASGKAGVNEASFERLELATGLAVSHDFVFVALPTVRGHGYDVWRLSYQLTNAKKILERGAGCCGQFDIQSDGTNLVVAENCNFQVAYYDTDGQALQKFGKRSAKEADGFGSCCNPMNVFCDGDQVLTAESSIGHIKRFSSNGDYLGFVGTVPIGGGCKHVALAHDRPSDQYFMFNEDRKCISVLASKNQANGESDDERATRLAMSGLGSKLIGRWEAIEPQVADNSMARFLSRKYGKLHFHTGGEMHNSSLTESVPSSSLALESLARISGSDEAARMLVQPCSQSRWSAIEQIDESLKIGFLEDSVASFEARVQFTNPDLIEMSYFYGSSKPIATLTYRRTNP